MYFSKTRIHITESITMWKLIGRRVQQRSGKRLKIVVLVASGIISGKAGSDIVLLLVGRVQGCWWKNPSEFGGNPLIVAQGMRRYTKEIEISPWHCTCADFGRHFLGNGEK